MIYLEILNIYINFYYKSKSDFLPDEKIIKINNTSKNSKNILQENKNEENKYINKIKQNIWYIPFTDNGKQNRSEERKNIKARFNQLLCDNKDICPFILNIVNAVQIFRFVVFIILYFISINPCSFKLL